MAATPPPRPLRRGISSLAMSATPSPPSPEVPRDANQELLGVSESPSGEIASPGVPPPLSPRPRSTATPHDTSVDASTSEDTAAEEVPESTYSEALESSTATTDDDSSSGSSSLLTATSTPTTRPLSDGSSGSESQSPVSANEKARAQIAREVLDTERSYVESLFTMINLYKKPLYKMAAEPKSDIKEAELATLFSNVEQLMGINSEILKRLHERVRLWSSTTLLGDIFKDLAPYLKMYSDYSNNYDQALQAYNKLMKDSPRFQQHCDTQKQRSSGMTLEHYLITPVQRIPRYNLLLRDLINKTEADHPDYENLTKALAATEAVSQHINATKGRVDNMKKLVGHTSKKGRGFAGLLQAHRHLIHDELLRIFDGTYRNKLNCVLEYERESTEGTSYKLHFYLFNDLFVYATPAQVKKHKDMSKLKSQFPLGAVWVRDRGQLNSFDIHTPTHIFVVHTDDDRSKTKWLNLLKTNINACVDEAEKERQKQKAQTPEDPLLSSDVDSDDDDDSDDDSDDDDKGKKKKTDLAELTPKRRFFGYVFFDAPYQATYRGWWVDGLMQGQGELVFNGNRYIGEFEQGDRSGLGAQTFASGERHEGLWMHNTMHGMGSMLFPNGDKYMGSFKNNTFHGKGTIVYTNGDTYAGAFEEGKPHGKGQLALKALALSYDGDFENGLFHGSGALTSADGTRNYTGQWMCGQKHGLGTQTTPTLVYTGSYRQGVRQGAGKLTDVRQTFVYEGEFSGNQPCGQGTLTTTAGTFVGKFADGQPSRGDAQMEASGVYSGSVKDLRFHGAGTFTAAAGSKWEGTWENGKRQGKFTATVPAGRVVAHCKDSSIRLQLSEDTRVQFDVLPSQPLAPAFMLAKLY